MTEREKTKKKWKFRAGKKSSIFLLEILAIFIAGYILGAKGIKISPYQDRLIKTEVSKPTDVDFSLYWEAWNKLKEKTALQIDAKKMVQGSISGMMASLGDPYTTYFEPSANKRFREDISGEFGGIGVEIISKNGLPTVVAPLSDSPAEKAGLKPNDIIIEVDDTKTSEIGFDETINKIRGAKGTVTKLKIARENVDEALIVDVTRDTIVVKSVESSFKEEDGKKIMVVKIRQFGDDTDGLFDQVAKDVLKNKSDGVIIDLRNNPGGYLETAVNLASYFIDGGVVVSEKSRDNESREYKTTEKAKLKDFKVVVLVNKGSASASEIFSGALQDRGAAKIIGETTFGKGSVQELVDLSDGSAVKITVAKWYTPNGRQISDKGIDPDITVANDDKTPADEQLDRAMEYLKTGK